MKNPDKTTPERLALEIFETLANIFPVCCASDEFFYFPQVPGKARNWSSWDDFSDTSLQYLSGMFSEWQEDLLSLSDQEMSRQDRTDISLLEHLCKTLSEQLIDVAFHRTQPTFYLTVASIGIVEAMESDEKEALGNRIDTLSDFLLTGFGNLNSVPEVFCNLGIEMAEKTCEWLRALALDGHQVTPALDAVKKYSDQLVKLPVNGDFRLPMEVLARIVSGHMGCEMGIEQIITEMEQEADSMKDLVKKAADGINPGRDWQEVYECMPREPVADSSLREMFENQIGDLMAHCLSRNLVPGKMALSCPVTVEYVPDSLSAIRSADSYSAKPGHPPAGGTFYIFREGNSERTAGGLHPEYRMTAAHETWPGHHMLDIARWSLKNTLRRPLERPLFYEGWACFAEQLMLETGYFSGQQDILILAKRRMRHALRGLVDLSLHSGLMDIQAAASTLTDAGYSRKLAEKTALKYTLHPGYQVCYTIGRRRFGSLFDRFGRDHIPGFVKKVLEQGEVPFSVLEKALSSED